MGGRRVSTRVEGAAPPVILLTAKAALVAGSACLMLTVTEGAGNLWRYNLSEQKNNRIAYGKIIIPGHMAALRRAAEICADGYQPGSVERGLLDGFAQGTSGNRGGRDGLPDSPLLPRSWRV
jgi:hypothetical protein